MDSEEHFFNCPYCGEKISMILDISAGSQSYVEDCEVCCNPIQINYDADNGKITSFSASRTDE
jgi:transcription elongation factor Elf1